MLNRLIHETIFLRGGSAQIESWRRELARVYAPQRLVLAIPADVRELSGAAS